MDEALGKSPSPNAGEGRGKGEKKAADPLSDVWSKLGWKVRYIGGTRWEFPVDLSKEPTLSGKGSQQAIAEWLYGMAKALGQSPSPNAGEGDKRSNGTIPPPTPEQVEMIRTKWVADLKKAGILTDEDNKKLNGERN